MSPPSFVLAKASFAFLFLLLQSTASVSGSPVAKQRQFPYNCGGNVTLQRGRTQSLLSPNFPYTYSNGLRCLWVANAPQGTVINMKCSYFNVAPSTDCYYDAFYYSFVGDTDLEGANHYCGFGVLDLTTTGNTFAAGFRTQNQYLNYQYPGFNCILSVVEATVTTEKVVPKPETTKAPKPETTKVQIPETTKAPKPVTKPPVTDDCPCGVKGESRIVGGQETGVNEWPWQAGFRHKQNNDIFCGATLISDLWLVTASHCVEQFKKEDLYVSLGDHQKNQQFETNFEQHITIDTVIMHEQYDTDTVNNDIALIRLSKAVTFNNGIRPICLPRKYANKNFSGEKATVTGWGKVAFDGAVSAFLQEVELPILTTSECKTYSKVTSSLTENMICTLKPGFDACQGDSGGPLQWGDDKDRQYLIGIVSFGFGCADEDSPGVYTQVTNYLDWIESKTGKLCYPA